MRLSTTSAKSHEETNISRKRLAYTSAWSRESSRKLSVNVRACKPVQRSDKRRSEGETSSSVGRSRRGGSVGQSLVIVENNWRSNMLRCERNWKHKHYQLHQLNMITPTWTVFYDFELFDKTSRA
ncbi:hypothetical protein ANCDUO_02352 [Ancylostoma duodenale]|uniref:Uncharacterized protein n=1 Tax=Ancylostoma duodenale TaxID=51022 RepID=A0A0C2DBW1_9BILA|nr:hypothetical protein ANCDUO_02352 [Ancylostoma duodenale]